MAIVECVYEADCELGESCIWSVDEQALFFVDILGRAIHRFDPRSGERRSWATPSEVGSIGFRKQGGLIAALRDGFYGFDLESGAARPIATGLIAPDCRFNDGRVDPAGRFWAGSMADDHERSVGTLWCLERDGSARRVLENLVVPNALAFSPDWTQAYHADSPSREIGVYPFDVGLGRLGERRTFTTLFDTPGFPDGSCVDREGFVWNAQFENGRVVRYAPDGRVDRILLVPVEQATSCCLGGPDLETLFITTAREGYGVEERARKPLAGALFAAEVDVPGLPEPAYAG